MDHFRLHKLPGALRLQISHLIATPLVVCLCTCPGISDDKAQGRASGAGAKTKKDRTLVASLFGEDVYLGQLTPAGADAKRKELSDPEFQQWLNKYRGRRVYQTLWRIALARYVEDKNLEVTKEEFAGIVESVERRLLAEKEPPVATTFTPEERKGVMVAWTRASFVDWKVCAALHAQFGGRVGIGSLGAWTAFDGQNALLKQYHKSGELRFHHQQLEEAFWQHTKITNFADAYPKGERLKKLLSTPPYERR